MSETLVKGFIIGLLVSSPMGPINLLTIQRTLNRGRLHGFVSGMGAMLSDFTYATITLFGLNFVSDFLLKNESLLQLVASVILIVFGFTVFRSNPLKGWTPKDNFEGTRYLKDFVSSFLLTFSNVAIILVFIGLFARFSFNPLKDGLNFVIAGIVGFILAAIFWWYFLTLLVAKFRKKFNRKGLIILNRIIGLILILIGIGGIVIFLFYIPFPF